MLTLIAWIAIDYRRQKQRLRDSKPSGVVRRSGRSAMDTQMSEPSTTDTPPQPALAILADGAAADRVRRAGRAVLVPARQRRSLEIPSALIGHPAPQTALPPLPGPRRQRRTGARARSGRVQGQGQRRQRLGLVVHAVPRRGAAVDPARPRQAAADRSASTTRTLPITRGAFSAATAIPIGIVGVDGNGRAAIEWGVYGVPETFIVGREGTIVYKMVGPVTPDNIDTVLKVEIDKALKAGS